MAGFRSLQTDPARCKQLHLQSLFSFRRLAPADDYLGSPCSFPSALVSSGFLPFFWAFGPGFPLPPLSSPSACFPFVPLASGSGYSASCSSFQPSIGSASQGLSQRPDPFFRPDQIFLFLTDWFPVRSFRFCLFSSPVCSLSLFPVSLPQPFHRCFSFLPVLPFYPLIRPCVRSLRFHPASFRPLSFPFAPVRLGLRYSVSVSSFPCFKLPPHSGFHSAAPLSVPPRLLRFPSFGPPGSSNLRFLRSSAPAPRSPLPLSRFLRFVLLLRSPSRRPLSVSLVRFAPDSVLGSAALLFTAPGFASQLLLPFACLPSRVQAFPLASFFRISPSDFPPFASGFPSAPFVRLRFQVTGHNDTP